MKVSKLITFAASALAISQFAYGSFQPSFATVNGNFYDLNAATGNPDFQGSNLGTFDFTTQQLLLGAEMNITGVNVEFSNVGWAVRDSGGSLVGSFVEVGGTYDSTPGGNDRWLLSGGARPDAINGLSSGDYTLEVYLHGKYNGGGDFFESNSSNNYIANFTVVPEPGTFALLSGLLALSFIALKRRN